MEVMEAIKARRSIRKYKPDPVDDQALNTVLDAARLAPSWSNTQCWRFIVVRDGTTRARLADILHPPKENPAEDAVRNAPIVIVACAQMGQSGFKNGLPTTNKGDWCMLDVGLAMENLVLAATALGLATVHVGDFDARKAETILGVPEGFCIVEMTPLGYPAQIRNPRPRKELSEIIFYERFGQK